MRRNAHYNFLVGGLVPGFKASVDVFAVDDNTLRELVDQRFETSELELPKAMDLWGVERGVVS